MKTLTITDYDGSVHLNEKGKRGAYPSESQSARLTDLSKNPDTPVVIITGRDHDRAREIFGPQLKDPSLNFALFSDSGGSRNASKQNKAGDPIPVGPKLGNNVVDFASVSASDFLAQYNEVNNKSVELELAPENTSFFIRIQDPHAFSECGSEQHDFMIALEKSVSKAIKEANFEQKLFIQLGNDELAVKSFSKEMILEDLPSYFTKTGIDTSQYGAVSYTGDEANDESAYIATNNLREEGVVAATYRVSNCSSHFLDKKPNSPNQDTNASFYLIGGPDQHIMYDNDMATTMAAHQKIELELKKVGLHKPGEVPLVLLNTESRKDVLVQNVTAEQTKASSFNKTLKEWNSGKLVLCTDSSEVANGIIQAAQKNDNILVVNKQNKIIYQAGNIKPLVDSKAYVAASEAAEIPPYKLFTKAIAELRFVKGVEDSLYNTGIVTRREVQKDMSAFAKTQPSLLAKNRNHQNGLVSKATIRNKQPSRIRKSRSRSRERVSSS